MHKIEKKETYLYEISKESSISRWPVKRKARFGITRFFNRGRGGSGGTRGGHCFVKCGSEGFLSGSERVGACRCGEADKAISTECIPGRCSSLPLPPCTHPALPYIFSRSDLLRASAQGTCSMVRDNSRELQNADNKTHLQLPLQRRKGESLPLIVSLLF